MIIRDGKVYAAGCILPLTDNHQISSELGTRHRAGVGMSENSDAMVVIVSEETGTVSTAVGGELKRNFSSEALRVALENGILWDRARRDENGDIKGKLRRLREEVEMKGRFSLNRILHNNRLIMVLSLIAAIVLWASVVYGSSSNEKRNIYMGTYTLSFADNSYAKETGLSIIQGGEVDVQVEVSGPRFRINQAQSEISVSADLSSIVRPGTYKIPLTATGASDYTIDAINPSSVTVVADYVLSKSVLLTTDVSAVTVPEGIATGWAPLCWIPR